jgi:hypothetical protein
MPVSSSNLDTYIDILRLNMGDIDSTAYRYVDDWLRTALVASVKTLQTWWNYKYLIDTNNDVTRNSSLAATTYEFTSPPILQMADERPVILMAMIILKEGSLENASWSIGSWKDNEISYSNIQAARTKENGIDRDWNELTDLLKPPGKRLIGSSKQSLKGYKSNPYERKTLY